LLARGFATFRAARRLLARGFATFRAARRLLARGFATFRAARRLLARGFDGRVRFPRAAPRSNLRCAMSRPPTNTEMEERWVDAWNDLYDVFGGVGAGDCALPDGSVIDFEACQSWLQQSAYEGYRLAVTAGTRDGRRVALVTRRR
jgi:hypothetical protein